MKARLTWKHWALALVLLLLFFAQGAAAIPRLSLTADEPAFVGPGLAYLQTGDLRLETAAAHPPLLFVLTAAPLLLQPVPDVRALPGWAEADLSTFSRAFTTALGEQLDAATFAMRLPILLLGVLGAALVFRWAADWFGPWAGLAALALFTFDPNILAHATLATTDLGLAVFGFASAYLLHRFLRHERSAERSLGLYLAAGLALGLTLGAKSSGVFALLVLVPLFLVARLFVPTARRSSLPRALAEAAGLVGLAVLVLWALYRFEVRPVERLGGLPLPFATQWETWLGVQSHAGAGHTAFLMGQIRGTGWWYYYPVAFVLKTPLPILVLLVVSVVAASLQVCRFAGHVPNCHPPTSNLQLPISSQAFLWLYPAAYALVTLFSTIAIGYRFLLVILPFLFVFVSQIANGKWRTAHHASRIAHHVLRFTFCVLLTWQIVGTIRLSPHYLAYFNELAGGPYEGYRYLVDSNLDWGQSFKALRAYLDGNQAEPVWLSTYTYTDPALYDIRYRPIAPVPGAPPVLPSRFDPAPGVYVIGATTLQGVMVADSDTYDWFRHRLPLARPGVALFVYRVAQRDEPPTWLAQCTVPVVPLSGEAAEEGFGRAGLRTATFDCTSAWLYPAGGESSGWYALFRDTARSDDVFIQTRLSSASLSFEQRRPGALPPFAIYEQDSPPPPPHFTPAARTRVGLMTFLGYADNSSTLVQSGQTVEVETWWRVESLPERPLSIMMHLVGPGSTPAVVGDGLGVPVEQWQVGDIIAQRHRLSLPPDAPPGEYAPVTGIYWLDTMERWQVEIDGEITGDQLALPTIQVTAEQ